MLRILILATAAIAILTGSVALERSYDLPNALTLRSEYGFSFAEIAGLNDYERAIKPANTRIYDRQYKPKVEDKYLAQIKPVDGGVSYTGGTIDDSLPLLQFALSGTDGNYPKISYDAARYKAEGREVNFYFEIDTSPDFNSPMLVRYPNLVPVQDGKRDVFNPSDVVLDIHDASIFPMFEDGHLALPFSAQVFRAAMPANRRDIGIHQLEAISHLLADGLKAEQRQRQVYDFVKLNLIWGGDSRSRGPVESFVAKVVGCGHMSGTAGALLEMAGDRFRIVSGFDPRVRPTIPRGGHSSIEVYNPETGQWSYLDAFLDVYAPGVAAEDFTADNVGAKLVYSRKVNGEMFDMTLAKLFRFRSYGDRISRRAVTPMTHLADEASYGLGWKTGATDPQPGTIRDTATVYVRGRYGISNCAIVWLDDPNSRCEAGDAKLSPWAVQSFEVSGR